MLDVALWLASVLCALLFLVYLLTGAWSLALVYLLLLVAFRVVARWDA